jgi:2-phospho-L-lactate guanylyltransferase
MVGLAPSTKCPAVKRNAERAAAEVVVAVRGGPQAKSRCGSVLDAQGRAHLVQSMLTDMLETIRRTRDIAGVHVVTPTMELGEVAARYGADTIIEQAPCGINAAFDLARRRIATRDASATLVLLPGDLPALRAHDLERAIRLHRAGTAVIASDIAGEGTGALILAAGASFAFSFGPASFRRHVAAARANGLAPRMITAASLQHDVDALNDLRWLLARGGRSRTVELLRSLRLGALL